MKFQGIFLIGEDFLADGVSIPLQALPSLGINKILSEQLAHGIFSIQNINSVFKTLFYVISTRQVLVMLNHKLIISKGSHLKHQVDNSKIRCYTDSQKQIKQGWFYTIHVHFRIINIVEDKLWISEKLKNKQYLKYL